MTWHLTRLRETFYACSALWYMLFYLVLSNRLLKSSGTFTLLKYTFTGAAVSSLIVTVITGFDAPILDQPIHWLPLGILLFVLIFPTVVSYMLIPIGLKYLSTTLVAIYGYLILIVATIVSLFYRARPVQLDTWPRMISYLCDLYRCISGGNCREQR